MGSPVPVWYKGTSAFLNKQTWKFSRLTCTYYLGLIQIYILQTIALIAVREGVVQLGGIHKVLDLSKLVFQCFKLFFPFLILSFWVYILKVIEDLSYVVLLRKKFSYIESIPGVLLPHPSSSAYPCSPEAWHFQGSLAPPAEFYEQFNQPLRVTPSMSSLEALLSKLPSVVPPTTPPQSQLMSSQRALEFMGMEKVAKEETDDHQEVYRPVLDVGESSTSMSAYRHHQHHFHQNQEWYISYY